MDIRRMATLNRTCFFDMTQITGILNHSGMSFFFCHSQRVTKMAWGTTDDRGIMGRIEFLVFMAAQTHIDAAGTGHIKFFRPLQQLFMDDEPTERKENGAEKKEFQQVL
jgi:hypothetical protein